MPRYHIPEASYHRPSAADKERALAMYQEGSSLSAAARVFGVSAQAVSQWVKRGPAAVAEPDGRRWVDFEAGDRSENTFALLPEAELYRSDAYAVYGEWLSRGRHVSGKGNAVNWNEGLHSSCRGKLNHLVRRTKGYTKSPTMLGCSLVLILAGWPSKPNTRLR